MTDLVVIAILARDKAHTLPLYLSCIEHLEYPKKSIALYIRTNNNSDNSIEIIKTWLKRVESQYESVYYSDVDLQQDDSTVWSPERFKVISSIRQASIDYAIMKKAHYFVVDCDNFIMPNTLAAMWWTNLPVIGPMLPLQGERYANYHVKTTVNGYYSDTEHHDQILSKNYRGILMVDVVHCTYFIRNHVLKDVKYDDDTARHEYVIFSDNLRQQNIAQYIDNRYPFGQLTMARTMEDFKSTIWTDPYFIERIKEVYEQ